MPAINHTQSLKKIDIIFDTKNVILFEKFLLWKDQKKLTFSLPIPLVKEEKDWKYGIIKSTHIPDYEYNWVFLDIRGSYGLIKSLTVKHLLYIYYHYIFDIPMYSLIFEKKDINGSFVEVAVICNEYTKNDRKEWRVFPIVCYQERPDALKELRTILKKFKPNTEYDKKEEDQWETLLRTGEIFNYLVATSKILSPSPSHDKIRNAILEDGGRADFSNEELDNQMDIVRKFLSHTL